jgi:transporter family-2 protein
VKKSTGVALSVVAGLGISAQARINGELAQRIDDGIGAATISFGFGLVLLLCVAFWMRPGLSKVRLAIKEGSLKPWQCLGGACGAFLVATQGLTVPTIGVAIFTVAVVAGQSGSSLAVDRAGVAPGGPRPITRNRALGALLCVAAVGVAVSSHLGNAKAMSLALLPLLAGIGIAWQQGVNGRVRLAAGSVWPATLINFIVGTAALLPVLAVELAIRGLPNGLPAEPWLYLGGPLGITFIAVAAGIVEHIGVLLLGLGTIAGQVAGALVIDTIAPVAGKPGLATFIGAAIALGAVALAARPARVAS